jgi:WD40 repeat protein/serine/threonine protein kinase/tetratricopeptide (TPR) repeat protein
MPPDLAPDEALVQRLPLPLAQLYRRAHNAKTPLERYLTAFYLWEAALKLLASVAVIEYAELGDHDPQLAERLQGLARPALGHWWEFARRLTVVLAERGDEPTRQVRELLLGKARDDLPRAAGLDALLQEALEGKPGARATVRLGELFDRLVRLRNEELGHGAAGQRPAEFYGRAGPALLAGLGEVLARLDVLAGRRLIHVADVRRLASGAWLVERYDLAGEAARRLESLEVPEAEAARLPRPGRLYLHGPGDAAAWRSLHPLLLYDAEAARVFFLNARRGQRAADYLCYTTGEVARRDELGQEQRALLARVLGGPVDEVAVAAWAERSRAEEPALAESPPERRTVGEFELISRLGQGGMGVVYRAWQPSLGRQVALKCLLRSGDPKAETRFAREIRALGKVEHPNVVKVFTSGADGEQWFYAMELVEGADLGAVCARLAGSTASDVSEDDWTTAVSRAYVEQRRQEQPLSGGERSPLAPRGGEDLLAERAGYTRPGGQSYIARVVEVVRQAAEAAQALHEGGVIHRDIKPGNILLSADGGHAVLMDLGLALLADETAGRRLTLTRQFVGTLRYASPEQLGCATVDRRADVYGLGATLWELLTLRPIFGVTQETPTPDLILRIQQMEPERVRKHNPRVPADLEAIVVKCLAKERERRYATAAELAADLGRWQRGEPVLAQPPSLGYLLGKQVRRYRVPLAVTAAVLVAAVVGVVVAFVQISAALEREKLAKQATQEALGREKDARQEAQDRARDASASLTKEQEALRSLEAGHSRMARSFSEVSDQEFHNGNVRDSVNCMLQAYEVAPETDPLRESYRRLIAARARDLERRLPHEGMVRAVAFSADGRVALTGGGSTVGRGEARLWDVRTGKQLTALRLEQRVLAMALSPDGKRALITEGGLLPGPGELRLWDVTTGKPVGEPLRHEAQVWAAAFSPEGTWALTGSEDNTARLWKAATGKQVAVLQHRSRVYAVAFSPDGRRALTGSWDGTARLWEVPTGKELATLSPRVEVHAVAFSPDGKRALTGGGSLGGPGELRLWDVETGKPLGEPMSHKLMVNAVAFSPDGRLVLTGSDDDTAWLWDPSTGNTVSLRHEGKVAAVAFSPDGRLALTGSGDGTVRLWDVLGGKQVASFYHDGLVDAVAFSPDGRTFLSGSGSEFGRGEARLSEVPTGKRFASFRHSEEVLAVAFSPDGRRALTGSMDKTARLWEVTTGKELAVLSHNGPVRAVAFSPDGMRALTGAGSADGPGEVRLWEGTTGNPVGEPLRHKGEVRAVAFSPDGRLLLTGSGDKTARLWDADTRKEVFVLQHEWPVEAVAFGPDGRLALTCSGHEARLWDVATGKQLGQPLRHETPVKAVAFSPDGKRAMTGCAPPGIGQSGSGEARLWELATCKELAVLRHTHAVESVAFSPDGRLVLTGGGDILGGGGEARLWEIATGKEVAVLGHSVRVAAVAFSPDGRLALIGRASFGFGGEAALWDVFFPLPPDEPARVRAWVAVRTGKAFDERGILRDLSPDEWLQHCQKLEAGGEDWQPAADPRRWHLAEAAEAEAQQAWFAARFHLERLLKDDPDNLDLLRRRGNAHAGLRQWEPALADYTKVLDHSPKDATALAARGNVRAEMGQWQQAVADYRQASSLQPDDVGAGTALALALLGADDPKGYQAECRRMLDRHARTQDPATADAVASVLLLRPDTVSDWGPVLELAELAHRSDANQPGFLETLGAVLYRAGRFREALDRLNEVVTKQGEGSPWLTQLFLAMAHHRLGHADDAKRWLAKAVEQFEKIEKGAASPWYYRIMWRSLREEAEALLKEAP